MQKNNILELPQMSNLQWCWKNEQHLYVDQSFDHQMSLGKSKCQYSNNCLHFLKYAVPLEPLHFTFNYGNFLNQRCLKKLICSTCVSMLTFLRHAHPSRLKSRKYANISANMLALFYGDLMFLLNKSNIRITENKLECFILQPVLSYFNVYR